MMNRKPIALVLLFVPALSVTILSCGAMANLPNPFASATPTATATFTPTITPSPTPTATSTATPVPTGVVMKDALGGGSLFFDYDGGYVIDIPSDWAAVLLEPGDMEDAISQYAEKNPIIADAIKNQESHLSEAFRMVALDKSPDHYADGYVANFSIAMFQEAPAVSMPLDLLIQVAVDEAKRQMPGAKIKILPSTVNAQAIKIGATESEMSFNVPNQGRVAIYAKQYYFQTKKAFVLLAFYVPKSKAALVMPLFDKVVNGIKLLP